MTSKSYIDVVLGTASFGTTIPAGSMGGVTDRAVIQSILDEFKSHGHNILDTARIYAGGTSETVLGELDYASQGFLVDTKIATFAHNSLTAENLNKSLQASLTELKTNKVRALYLHSPDRSVPLEVTLHAVNEAYKKGHFEEFGLSNYSAEEVEQAVKICKEKGYVKPTLYQGLYNLVARGPEADLFPVLRKHGIRFYAYSPLAGSFLTSSVSKDAAPNARFDPSTMGGQIYRSLFYKDSHFKALDLLKESANKHGITVQELAIRWLTHHSALKREHKDAFITGGSRLANIKNTLGYAEQPPLPADALKVADSIWDLVKEEAAPYVRVFNGSDK